MMRLFVWTAMALICASLRAQTPSARPQFEVASVKAATTSGTQLDRFPMMREMMRNGRPPGDIPMADPGRIRLENWALVDLIAAAYRVRAVQVSGPAWLSDQVFDVEAKVAEGTPKEQVNAMLQSLLEDRFGLKAHRESQTKSGFALVVGKNGAKLKPAAAPVPLDPSLSEEEKRAKRKEGLEQAMAEMMARIKEKRESGLNGLNAATWPSITMDEVASRLVRFTEAPVTNETGLTGAYSVSIETWRNTDVPGGTIFDAVEKLGLKLEARKITVESVIVDQVSKAPTEN